jgi:3-oxoacyl-[acyl-carrier protein] reductase
MELVWKFDNILILVKLRACKKREPILTKVAIVTGGRRGIGRAICEALAVQGFAILAVDLEQDADAEATLDVVRQHRVPAAFFCADVSDISLHPRILEAAMAVGGELCCLVNNAGISTQKRGDILELTPESYDRVMGINLRSAFFLSQAFANAVIAAGSGTLDFRSIVNVSSINAEIMALDRSDYTLSKAGLSVMSKMFAARLAPLGVHVYEVRPGLIRTDMTKPVVDKYSDFIGTGGVPIARWGEPEDVGKAVALLASGQLSYSTGDHIRVDGGLGLRTWQPAKGSTTA